MQSLISLDFLIGRGFERQFVRTPSGAAYVLTDGTRAVRVSPQEAVVLKDDWRKLIATQQAGLPEIAQETIAQKAALGVILYMFLLVFMDRVRLGFLPWVLLFGIIAAVVLQDQLRWFLTARAEAQEFRAAADRVMSGRITLAPEQYRPFLPRYLVRRSANWICGLLLCVELGLWAATWMVTGEGERKLAELLENVSGFTITIALLTFLGSRLWDRVQPETRLL